MSKFDTMSLVDESDKWIPLPIVRVKKEPPRLKNLTKRLLKSLKPSIPEGEFTGGIKVKCGTIIARPHFAKTETIKQIFKELIIHYGSKNVNCLSGKFLQDLVLNMNGQPVQLLFVDDSTSLDKKSQKEMIQHYVTIRHDLKKIQIAREKKKIAGVIIVIFSSHSFYMLDKQIRTLFNFVIMKSSDSNAYNRRMIKDEFGKAGLDELDKITRRKEIHDDMSVLNKSVISMIGEKKGGYIYFKYDPKEAEIIPWKIIETDRQNGAGITESKLINKLTNNAFWGNFTNIMYKHLLKRYDSIQSTCGFTSVSNMRDCLVLWFNKFFLGKTDEQLLELDLVSEASIRPYVTRINSYFNNFDTRQFQKEVSEQWVLDGFSGIKPLSPQTLCTTHRASNQPSDVCLHDAKGNHVLSINVKWYANNRATTNSVDVSPEVDIPPHAILYIGSSRRSDHPKGHIRFSILKKKQSKIKIREIKQIIAKKDNGFILDEIGEIIKKELKIKDVK